MLNTTRNTVACLVALVFCLIFVSGVSASDKTEKSGVEPAWSVKGKISRVGQDSGRILVSWDGMPVYMWSTFTLQDCGRELPPTLNSLQSLVGKECESLYEEVVGGVEFKRIECACTK